MYSNEIETIIIGRGQCAPVPIIEDDYEETFQDAFEVDNYYTAATEDNEEEIKSPFAALKRSQRSLRYISNLNALGEEEKDEIRERHVSEEELILASRLDWLRKEKEPEPSAPVVDTDAFPGLGFEPPKPRIAQVKFSRKNKPGKQVQLGASKNPLDAGKVVLCFETPKEEEKVEKKVVEVEKPVEVIEEKPQPQPQQKEWETRAPRLCKYIQAGSKCPFEAKCRFSHDITTVVEKHTEKQIPTERKKALCRFVERGQVCTNKVCRFFHPDEPQQLKKQDSEDRSRSPPVHRERPREAAREPARQSKKIWFCKNMIQMGHCEFDTNCIYSHTFEEVAAVVGKCRFGTRCNLVECTTKNSKKIYTNKERKCINLHPDETIQDFVVRVQ
jgi:hypothetical protein